jgi:hypothetical protein
MELKLGSIILRDIGLVPGCPFHAISFSLIALVVLSYVCRHGASWWPVSGWRDISFNIFCSTVFCMSTELCTCQVLSSSLSYCVIYKS